MEECSTGMPAFSYHFSEQRIQGQSEQYCIRSLRVFVSFCLYECLLSNSSVREGCAKVISSFTSFVVESLKSVFSSQFRFINMCILSYIIYAQLYCLLYTFYWLSSQSYFNYRAFLDFCLTGLNWKSGDRQFFFDYLYPDKVSNI